MLLAAYSNSVQLLGQGFKCDAVKKPSGLTTTNSSTPNGSNYTFPVTTASKEDLARYHIASELLQTEKNFVKILNLIIKVLYYDSCVLLN